MSTRSRIGLTNPDGFISSVYCHSDGYLTGPHGVGHKLFEHYQEPVKIAALIALGDLSSLGKEVAPPEGVPHNFERRAPHVTVAYGRDRNESADDDSATTDVDVAEFLATAARCGAEYAYLWSGVWTMWDMTAVGHHREAIPENGQPLELALVTDRVTA